MELTQEQQRILAIRAQYAQIGINYDKATRRFLEQHAEEPVVDDRRPTVKIPVAVIDELRLRLANAE